MTRANVIQIGILILALGGLGYKAFTWLGFEGASAGIASESVLVFLVVGWTASYLFRVVRGNMTFMEQRRRYRKSYDELTTNELQARLDSMSEDEKNLLIQELENDKNNSNGESEL